jgi:predicted secreted protein
MPQKILGSGGSLVVTAMPATADYLTIPNGLTLPVTIPVESWEGTVNSDLQDVSDTASGGWQELIAGFRDLEATLTGWWDATTDAVSLAAILSPGRPITFALLLGAYKVTVSLGVPVGTTTPGAVTGTAFVGTFKITNATKEAIKWEVTIKSTGPVTIS